MGMITRFRQWRRERLIKAVVAQGLTVPSRRTLRTSWLPRWLRGDYTLRNSELIFSAVSRIANALSAMPVQLYKGRSEIKHELNDLIRFEPNPGMTSCQFFKTLEACRCTSGNCYAMKVFTADGTLARLDILDPGRVTAVMERDSGELWYRIVPEAGPEMYVHNYYVLHVPFISTNGFSGVNPVSVLCDTLKYSDSIQAFNVKQLEQGVNAAIVLEAPGNLGEEQKKEMIESFMETYRETSGNILLLESGVVAKALNLSPVDSKLLEVEKITRSKVAMVFNIPPHLLGDYSKESFSSQEQQMLEFLTLTMLPVVTAYEQELDRKLLTRRQRRNGYHFKFDMDSVLRADAATQADVYQKAIRGGWKTPNEVRDKYNDPPDPNGNKLLAARDLTTLQYVVEHPEGNGERSKSNEPSK